MKSLRVFLIVLLLTGFVAAPALAGEGMWTLDNLPVKQMQAHYGFTPTAAWIAHVEHSALRLAGGCSGSFVSADGLVMTNHHCANGCLSALSNNKHNYMQDGYFAAGKEAKCPDIELNQLESITDVTATVNAATKDKSGADYVKAQRAVIGNLEKQCVGNNPAGLRCEVVTLYHGGRYDLYKYKRYQDVRLVFAPEQSIAFFGGDPDNFNFPRYDLDVTFLRAYEHGKPAHTEYFHFDPHGPKAGEMTFVVGNPGSTERTYTVAQLRAARDNLVPLFGYLSELRGILWQYARQSKAHAQQAQDEIFGIDNALKLFKGRLQVLNNPALYATKQKADDALKQWVDASAARRQEYGDPWQAIAQAEKTYENYQTRYSMIERGEGFQSRLFGIARTLVLAAQERVKPNGERLPQFRDSNLPALEQHLFSRAPIYPTFDETTFAWSLEKLRQALGADDPFVHRIFGDTAPAAMAARLEKGTKLMSIAYRKQLWNGGLQAIKASSDPMIKFALEVTPDARAVRKDVEDQVDAPLRKASEAIAKARFARYGTSIYPDATFTLRLSYGKVEGWEEKGEQIPPFTDFSGAFRRATGSDPFKLPDSWIKARSRLNLATPFDFVTSNDIIGGNSGSPVIDRAGNAVGLIFDSNIHGLGGAYWYDGRTNRAVAVDTAALIEAIRKVYDHPQLANELITGHL